ncbi:hypothetical protein OF83DRAFT_178515 [Amylostereum chailletii]|nr:hypothetical protein OF83DRAFT_178515 [Amylostereum chailletii]
MHAKTLCELAGWIPRRNAAGVIEGYAAPPEHNGRYPRTVPIFDRGAQIPAIVSSLPGQAFVHAPDRGHRSHAKPDIQDEMRTHHSTRREHGTRRTASRSREDVTFAQHPRAQGQDFHRNSEQLRHQSSMRLAHAVALPSEWSAAQIAQGRSPLDDPPSRGRARTTQHRPSPLVLPTSQERSQPRSSMRKVFGRSQSRPQREVHFGEDDVRLITPRPGAIFNVPPPPKAVHRPPTPGVALRELPSVQGHAPAQEPIHFSNAPWDPVFPFSNCSNFPVTHEGVVYPTAEHLYHALKYLHYDPNRAELMRKCPNVNVLREQAQTARNLRRVRRDWLEVNTGLMDMIIRERFSQNEVLRRMLLETAGRELIFEDQDDQYWAAGGDGRGENMLGRALMRYRDWAMSTSTSSRRRRRDHSA